MEEVRCLLAERVGSRPALRQGATGNWVPLHVPLAAEANFVVDLPHLADCAHVCPHWTGDAARNGRSRIGLEQVADVRGGPADLDTSWRHLA